jgi:two-component system nitrogen regulation sensor histidine kinase NtrY
MPTPRTVPTICPELILNTLALYDGLFTDVTIDHRFAETGPVKLDPEQIRRVIINLIDNAIEAMERRGRITVETQCDKPNQLVRIIVADNGPGIPASEREKLFLPYYSTKRRGSGLGLAIRPADHRRARRQHRCERQRAARHPIYNRASSVKPAFGVDLHEANHSRG